MLSQDSIHQLSDHLFRHEAGKMVAVLTKVFGTENLETAEDVVQQTFMDALQIWPYKGIPDNPSAWLFRVAKNKAIDIIRRNKHSVRYDFNDNERALLKSEYTLATTMQTLWKEEVITDDMLRMMYACCHPEISTESQITIILKTLCGFSTSEIAKSFLTTEDTISKRLYRTKEFFRERKIKPEIPSPGEIKNRTNSVLNSIYLLFNEGYNSTHSDLLVRKDLMNEAILLCKLLTENKLSQLPEVYALLALMHFHVARSDSRITPEGELILLAKQDRSKWNIDTILEGNEYMNKAAFGDTLSSYHLEAAIAYEHCIASSYEQTNWKRILELYDWLIKLFTTPVIELNRAVALMQVKGAKEALAALQKIPDKKKLESFYLYYSLMGEINIKLKHLEEAKKNMQKALGLCQSETEKKFLKEKIESLN